MEKKFDLLTYLKNDYQTKNNFYEFFAFFININFNIKKIKNRIFKHNKKFLYFYHEYTHYLQSFCTVYGVNALLDFFKFQRDDVLTTMAKKIVKNESYDPFDYKQLFSSKYQDIINNYSYDLSEFGKPTNSNYELQKQYIITKDINKTDYILQIDNDILDISPLCLRETMAMMTFFITKKMSNKKIMKYINKNNITPIYSYLFIYFSNKYPKIKDLSILLFYICELSLQSKNPTDNLTIILDYLNKHYTSYTNASDFLETIWNNETIFENNITIMLDELQNFLNENIKFIQSGNKYFYLMSNYLQIVSNLVRNFVSEKSHKSIMLR